MKRIGLLMCLFMSGLAFGQQLSLQTTLPSSVKETSGLLYLHQRIITHNDSGGNAELYEIDPATGNVTRTVAVNNATNVDWEAICADDEYLYIGDFGNNAGSRTDLKIYRIRQSDYLEIDNDEVSAEVIHFAYADQTDFTPTNYATNFDAEAFVALEDQLCIFTKNWGDSQTNMYTLPKTPGEYTAARRGTINAHGWVTDAAYVAENNRMLLLGYTVLSPFVVAINDFSPENTGHKTLSRYQLSSLSGYSWQLEGITYWGQGQYYLTAEENGSLPSALFLLQGELFTDLDTPDDPAGIVFPNPSSEWVHFDTADFKSATFYDQNSRLLKTFFSSDVDISFLPAGMYYVVIETLDGTQIPAQRLVVL